MILPLSANLYKISNSLSMFHDCQSPCMCIRSILIYGLKYPFFNNVIVYILYVTIENNISRDLLHTPFILQNKFVNLTTQRQFTKSGATHSSVASRSPRNVTKASILNLSQIKTSLKLILNIFIFYRYVYISLLFLKM